MPVALIVFFNVLCLITERYPETSLALHEKLLFCHYFYQQFRSVSLAHSQIRKFSENQPNTRLCSPGSTYIVTSIVVSKTE